MFIDRFSCFQPIFHAYAQISETGKLQIVSTYWCGKV